MSDGSPAHGRNRVAPLSAVLSREDWPVLVGLPAVASLFVFALPRLGWWALGAAVLVYAAGFAGFERARATEAAHRELAGSLGRIVELAGVATPGQPERARRLAGDVARHLDLEPAAIDAIEDAAQLRLVGRLCIEGRDHLDSQAAERIASRRGAAVLAHAGRLARLTPFVAAEPPAQAAAARMRAAVDLAVAYDEAVTRRGDDPAAALDRLAESGPADVVQALRAAVGGTRS